MKLYQANRSFIVIAGSDSIDILEDEYFFVINCKHVNDKFCRINLLTPVGVYATTLMYSQILRFVMKYID